MVDSVLEKKSKVFAVKIVHLYQQLKQESREFILSKQLVRSGTSIGANVSEAIFAQSRKDFISKMQIALKEARETQYWIELLIDSNFIVKEQCESILFECDELCRMLHATVKTTKERSDSR